MSNPFIGQIQPFGFNFAPRSWAQCNGQLLPIAQNTALFSLLGTIYGGDGRVTFALPDLRGRTALHTGTGPGLTTRREGQRSGQERVILNSTQIPPLTGVVRANKAAGSARSPENSFPATSSTGDRNYAASADVNMGAVSVNVSGGGLSHDNMQPYLVVNWCIALQGVFPSRN